MRINTNSKTSTDDIEATMGTNIFFFSLQLSEPQRF